jgi:hypothetical protein
MKYIFILIGFLLIDDIKSQDSSIIQVAFCIPGKTVDFAHDISLEILVNNRKVFPLMYLNGFVIPTEIHEAKKIDVCFIYKRKRYLFTNVSKNWFQPNWEFEIKFKSFLKGTKLKYYLKFHPPKFEWVTREITEN